LGFPAKHSLSPAMHNAAFRALHINAEYQIFEVKPEELNDFLQSLSEKDIYGFNITVPYKEKILDSVTLDAESFYLRQIGAINTIVRQENILRGFNTDIPGFARHLKENFDPAHKRVAILGAGGAGKAVAYVLASYAAAEIAIFDIDRVKANNLAQMIKGLFPNFPILIANNLDELKIKEKDLLVNATPVGLKATDPCLLKEEKLHKHLFVYDLVYNPRETKLLALAKKVGAKTSNGLGMLLYQGMLSFEKWTGKVAPETIMRNALEKELEGCNTL
jgi:shikimate dehydrogenase